MATPKSNTNTTTIEFEFTAAGLAMFKKRLADLHMINPVARMKIFPDHVLIYSAPKTFHTFKSARFDMDEIFTVTKGPVPDAGLDYIFVNTQNVVQSVVHFGGQSPVRMRVTAYKEAKMAHEVVLLDDELSLKFIGGDATELKSITAAEIDAKMDPGNSDFSFVMTGEQLTKIKRLAQKRKDAETVTVWVRDGEVRIGQGGRAAWSVLIGQSDEGDTFVFNKKYLSTIEVLDTITVHCFDQFLLIKETTTHLMIGRELDEL